MSNRWRDQLAGARMQVDQQFNSRLQESQFTSQEWGLIMTAVEFDIENPEDPESAELVADTSKLEQIMPELENLPDGMGGAPGGGSGGSSDGGLFSSIASSLGLGGGGGSGVDQDKLAAAESLVGEYATQLGDHLAERGRWETICAAAANAEAADDGNTE